MNVRLACARGFSLFVIRRDHPWVIGKCQPFRGSSSFSTALQRSQTVGYVLSSPTCTE